jgi:DNA-binding transcriptional LysR family regulator
VRLLNRTNRSVTLTAAGEELQGAIAAPFDRIGDAVEALNRYRDAPTGRIRLNVVTDAAALLLGPVLPTFNDLYPDIEVEVTATNRIVDVTGDGYDAGIRYGGTVPEDMIATRLSADVRWLVAASSAYLARFGTPQVPEDLQHHRCLQIRLGDDRLYRWEFMRNGVEFAIGVPGPVIFNEAAIGLEMLRRGGG